ncbi:hypothetical protein [Paraburkholderia sp. ZP32-5]|uniref:hypothetical protein n=1 Tax=Paraburkholderia sp. ZP32-5 TaxID=2883245 RepID=UPI001F3BD970|nr:hypothetical protein [Paraburkholderia sp. ZP32-5]
MPFASKPIHLCSASQRKRLADSLAAALAIIALCTLTAACSDDAQQAGTQTSSLTGFSAQPSAASNGSSSFNAPVNAAANSATTTLTIQTPAPSASGASSDPSTALSAAAPLARPVIHSVD